MKTSGDFLHVTLNCIAAAITAGLATAAVLIFIVLLINGRAVAIDMKENQPACGNNETRCIVFQHGISTNDKARL